MTPSARNLIERLKGGVSPGEAREYLIGHLEVLLLARAEQLKENIQEETGVRDTMAEIEALRRKGGEDAPTKRPAEEKTGPSPDTMAAIEALRRASVEDPIDDDDEDLDLDLEEAEDHRDAMAQIEALRRMDLSGDEDDEKEATPPASDEPDRRAAMADIEALHRIDMGADLDLDGDDADDEVFDLDNEDLDLDDEDTDDADLNLDGDDADDEVFDLDDEDLNLDDENGEENFVADDPWNEDAAADTANDVPEAGLSADDWDNFDIEEDDAPVKTDAREDSVTDVPHSPAPAAKRKEDAAPMSDGSDIMYVILLGEEALGKLNRGAEEFYLIYGDLFADKSEHEVALLRAQIKNALHSGAMASDYTASFLRRSVAERFAVTAQRLIRLYESPDADESEKWAMTHAKDWFPAAAEWKEASRLMSDVRKTMKRETSDKLSLVDAKGKTLEDVKGCLHLVVTDETPAEAVMRESSHYIVDVDDFLVCVKLYHPSLSASLLLTDEMTPGLRATPRGVWEAAFVNEIFNESRDDLHFKRAAKEAMRRIRELYPAETVNEETAPAEEKKSAPQQKPTPTPAPSSKKKKQDASLPINPNRKKGGCYIATAVYGSYDAPEVMTLRRFRDETLSKSFFGRWFIHAYYFFSPPVAEWLKGAHRLNAFVRRLLDKWVNHLNKNQK